MKKVIVVDGNSLVNRAFYGVKPLTTRDGRNTNAVFGFINMLNRALTDVRPDYAAAAFDLKSPTFRHKAFDFYKATRKGMPTELAEQFDDAKRAAEYLGFHLLSVEGYEADDILGTVSSFASDDIHVYLLTGDRDSFQLVGDNVTVMYVSTKETKLMGEAEIVSNYEVAPRALIEVKALMGDVSDNIPGVKGIGEKTAIGLVKRFGTVQKLYDSLAESGGDIPGLSKSVVAKLRDGKESAFASRFLAEIKLDVPLGVTLDDLKYTGLDKKSLCGLCEKLELNSVINRLSLRESDSEEASADEKTFRVEINDVADVSCFPDGNGAVYFDFQGANIYFASDADSQNAVYRTNADEENLRALVCNPERKLYVHDIKSKLIYLYTLGIYDFAADFFDIMLASYAADPAGVITDEKLTLYCSGEGADVNNPEQLCAAGALTIKKLKAELEEKIKAGGQQKLLYDIEFPLAEVLAKMENAGFLINRDALEKYGEQLELSMNQRMNDIYELAGTQFNVNSPKQLGVVLFEKLGLPTIKKTKNGYSTDAETLEKLRPYSPIIDCILEYRTVSKLKSTYADGLIKALGADGRLHTNFKQAFTLTGRLSSAEPNLQNIPIRTAEGREIRKVFIPEQGKILIDADYSQIELRLMAALSGDENMIRTFLDGRDIHTMTASQVFGVSEADVTPEMRKKAKAVNFGIIYGISDFSLAGDIKVSKKEAGEYIKTYFEKYPKIHEYLEYLKKFAYENGYAETLYGRRRYIPELRAKNYTLRMFGERAAMNAPIQGTAADIIKIAMVRVYRRLEEEQLSARLILQVHDELIIESREDCAEKAAQILKTEMENAASLAVPLEVSVGIGKNWEECHS